MKKNSNSEFGNIGIIRRRFIVTSIFLLTFLLSYAARISLGQVIENVKTFVRNESITRSTEISELDLIYSGTKDIVGYPLYYIFNRSDGGYIVAAGDDCIDKVLIYSDSGCIDRKNMPDNMAWWIREYERMMAFAIQKGISLKSQRKQNRENIDYLLTCKWDQGYPYNSLCPIGGDGKRCMTGCVATALAQIMYYYRWPDVGFGTKEYTFAVDDNPQMQQSLSADFGKTSYQWNKMIDFYNGGDFSDDEKNAVATLMLHCGIALEMVYGTVSSSPILMLESNVLKNYFRYYYDIAQKNNVSDEDFVKIVYHELSEGRPVLVGGNNKDGEKGHLFVCDGYKDGYFHFNWGWSGAGTAYCLPMELIPNIQDFDFSYNHRLIYNIRPFKGKMPTGQVYIETAQPGNLNQEMPEEANYANSLKISGVLNGTDILTLRKLCGKDENGLSTDGIVTELDLEDVTFANGGNIYCENYIVNDETIFPNHGMYYTNIEKIILPRGINSIGECAFEMCKKLKNVSFNNNIKRIEREAFYSCENLESLLLPSNIEYIGPWAFDKSNLTDISLFSIIPPVAFDMSFSETNYQNATLYVPYGSLERYRTAEGWKNFVNIQEMDPETTIKGDANGDGVVNAADIVAVVNYIIGNPSMDFVYENVDINDDHALNAADIVLIVNKIMTIQEANNK